MTRIYALVFGLLVLLDQSSKFISRQTYLISENRDDPGHYRASQSTPLKFGSEQQQAFSVMLALTYTKNFSAFLDNRSSQHRPNPLMSIGRIAIGIAIVAYYFLRRLPLVRAHVGWIKGWTFFTAGIAGNTLDRIIWGAVVDWVHVRLSGLPGISLGTSWSTNFNLADVFMVIGMFLIVSYWIRHDSEPVLDPDS